jgi:protein-S-isoprenylcysteine O-methyltransferase Ste14
VDVRRFRRAMVINSVSGLVRRIPLSARMVVYGASFLAGVLVGLPWLAYRFDASYPQWHIEIGVYRILGAIVFTAFLIMYITCAYVLAARGSGAYVEFDPPRVFVVSGPYRLCRNPIAACVVGMLLGEAFALSSTGVFMLFLAAIPIAHLQVILLEEPLLLERFGAAYEDYRKRVPRWMPRAFRRRSL